MVISTSTEAEKVLDVLIESVDTNQLEIYHNLFPWSSKILNSLGICYCLSGQKDKGI